MRMPTDVSVAAVRSTDRRVSYRYGTARCRF
jgi:hypothetical protein